MRNERKINLANFNFNFQNKNITNINKANKVNALGLEEKTQTAKQSQKVKAISSELTESLPIVKRQAGITLIALVVTIVVLLILAGVSISTVLGNNGIIPRANEAKFKTDLANIQEEFKLYVMDKTAENGDFSVGSLNASANLLEYNTQPDEEKGTGNISSVLKSATAQKYIQSKSFSIIKGDLIYASQNAKELEWAQEVGLGINPYNIDENGVLLSSETNLMLMDEATGTLVIPEMVTAIGEGTFGNVKGLRRLVIPQTVTEIKAKAFYGNEILEEVIIQVNEEEAKGLKKIGNSAFKKCKGIKSIIIPNTVTYIGENAFEECTNLTDVTLSNKANLRAATFASCNSIKSIEIPEGITEIAGWGAFHGCKSLKTIYIPSTMKSMTIAAFVNCVNIESIILAEANTSFILEDGILLSEDRSQMIIVTKAAINGKTSFTIPEGVKELTTRSIFNI